MYTKDDVTEIKFIDELYTDMFELKMLAGSKIAPTSKSENDTTYDVVVNETMIHKLVYRDAANQWEDISSLTATGFVLLWVL